MRRMSVVADTVRALGVVSAVGVVSALGAVNVGLPASTILAGTSVRESNGVNDRGAAILPPCSPSWVPTCVMSGLTPVAGLFLDFSCYGALARDEDGATVLYLGGGATPDSTQATVRRWDGISMTTLGTLPSGYVTDIVEHDAGDGPMLYASGRFLGTDAEEFSGLARWNGAAWEILPSLLEGGSYRDILTMVSFDDGDGPALYAGGRFSSVGGVTAKSVARWRGGVWESLGTTLGHQVFDLHVHDDGREDGDGPFLVAACDPWGMEIWAWPRVLRWEDGTWQPLDAGQNDEDQNDEGQADAGQNNAALTGSSAFALATHDDGSGPKLYASMYVEGDAIWVWDGETWSHLPPSIYGAVTALVSHDDGTGPALYVGGVSTIVFGPGDSDKGIARFKDGAWSPVARGIGVFPPDNIFGGVKSLTSTPMGLIAAGTFTLVLDPTDWVPAKNFAIWGDGGIPFVAAQPVDIEVPFGGTAEFVPLVLSKELDGELHHQWFRNATALMDQDRLVGASSAVLTITDIDLDDLGEYHLVSWNDCGEVSTVGAMLIGCPGDVDGNGAVGAGDLGLLLAAWGSTVESADFNGDGTVDESDLAMLLASWGCGEAARTSV